MVRKDYLVGAAVAVGVLLLVPGVAAALARAGRPLAGAAMRTAATGYAAFRRAGAEVYEQFEDIAAEVRAEMRGAAEDAAAAAASAAAAGDAAAAPARAE